MTEAGMVESEIERTVRELDEALQELKAAMREHPVTRLMLWMLKRWNEWRK